MNKIRSESEVTTDVTDAQILHFEKIEIITTQ